MRYGSMMSVGSLFPLFMNSVVRRALWATGLLAASWSTAWAGAQIEEPLADSVRSALSAAVGRGEPPKLVFADEAQRQQCARWTQAQEARLRKRKPEELVRHEFLNTVCYEAKRAAAVDMFPGTAHVETVVLLSKGEVDSKKIRVEFSLEDMDMSEFQDGATYTQIKDYVLEHSGLKVSNLYISQIKRKCGIEVGKNYNLPKSEDSRQPQCPPEKEKAIREAFKYFGMI